MHGQKPHDDVLSNGLACAECATAVIRQLPNKSWLCECSDLLCRGWKRGKQANTALGEGVLSQTTCDSKSWTRGSYLAVTAVIVNYVYLF